MGDLSLHFSKHEFACRCKRCRLDGSGIDRELIAILELIRAHFSHIAPGQQAVIGVNSGHRCPEHNKNEGGSPTSQHLFGKAADIVVGEKQHDGSWARVSPLYVVAYLDQVFPHSYGIGTYETFTHVDTRDERSRW